MAPALGLPRTPQLIRELRAGTTGLSAVEREYCGRTETLFVHLRVNGVTAGRDVLALAASQGRYQEAALLAAISAEGEVTDRAAQRALLESFDRTALLHLATLIADQDGTAAVSLGERHLLRTVADLLGARAILKEGRFRLLELLVAAGQSDDLPALLKRFHIGRDDIAQPFLYAANANNPFRAVEDEREPKVAGWLREVNDMFAIDGLEPIGIAPGDEDPFDRILGGASSVVADGPLVTVVIPTYNPGYRIATAIESLLAQSYRALQILVVDDASPPEVAAQLDRWAERDPRIQVVHLAENNGPYLARNIAVSRHAAGDYVMIHDDDDWSHPRKIELQVAQLQAEPDFAANMAYSVRASGDLQFGRINGNPVWTQQGLSTLMVRRRVFDEIGYWDVLNRSADAEFNDRIRSWSGTRIPIAGRVPTAFYRVRWNSLSAGEFNRGYMDSRRRWYFHSYLHWHKSALADGGVPYLPVDNRGARPFSAPADLLGSRIGRSSTPAFVDIVFVSDFRLHDESAESVCCTVEEALAGGLRVALLQLDSPVYGPEARIHSRILEVAPHPNAIVVSLADSIETPLALVLDPTVLQFVRRERAGFTPGSVVILDRVRHSAEEVGGALYNLSDVLANAEMIFGRRPDVGESGCLPSLRNNSGTSVPRVER